MIIAEVCQFGYDPSQQPCTVAYNPLAIVLPILAVIVFLAVIAVVTIVLIRRK